MLQKRRACRSTKLAFDIARVYRYVLEQTRRCGRGYRQHAVRTFYIAFPDAYGRDNHALRVNLFKKHRCSYDVGNRIDCAELVKVYLRNAPAVDCRFSLGDERVYGLCIAFDARRNVERIDYFLYIRQ